MNKILLIGRLTRDPEIKLVGENNTVANFTLAVNRPFRDKQTGEYETDFFNCQAWGERANTIATYVKKGHQFSIVGRVQIRQYQADDGSNRYATEVVVEDFTLLNNRDNQEQNQKSQESDESNQFSIEVEEEDGIELNI